MATSVLTYVARAEDAGNTKDAILVAADDAEKPKNTNEDANKIKGESPYLKNTTLFIPGVLSFTLGGFIEAAGIYRSRNLESDMASNFSKLPLPGVAITGSFPGSYYQHEFRFSARQSRLSLLSKDDIGGDIHIAGYYEMDFLGAAGTANANESNSFTPRIRQLYATVDWDKYGLHLLAGQAWSLVTMNAEGISPLTYVSPKTIDAQYVPGFTWTRQPQMRIVKDFGKIFWIGVSIENPQTTIFTASGASVYTNLATGALTGGNFDPYGKQSVNDCPDGVLKLALDPGWGHIEVFDLARSFLSSEGVAVNFGGTTGTVVFPPANHHTITNAWGGSVILPIVKKILELQASGIYGRGIGRYGSAQLPDATQSIKGAVIPLTGWHMLFGLVINPIEDLTFYGYAGEEQVKYKNYYNPTNFSSGSNLVYGYGNPLANNLFVGGNALGVGTLPGAFSGNIKQVAQATIGMWWKFLKGKFGNTQLGLQYSYTSNKYFSALGGAPRTNNQMAFLSMRYYW